MRSLLLGILITVLHGLPALAQLSPPQLHCVEVNADGSVTLSWTKPGTQAGFSEYEIWYADTPTSSYTMIGQVTDFNQESYTHAAAGANNGSRYYYLVTSGTPSPSAPSDTLQTIFLSLTTTDYENVFLVWNKIHVPRLPTTEIWYRVYREYPAGNWIQIDTLQGASLFHHFLSCNEDLDKVNFRIEVRDMLKDCNSVSNVTGEVLSNSSKPDMPVIDSVSIDDNGNAIIGWTPSQAADVKGYIIYRVTTINDSLTFIPGKLSSSYLHAGIDPCSESYRYAIAAVDSCGNESPGTFDMPQGTLLFQVEYDPCQQSNTLSWNEYINFSPPLSGYRIYVSENDGPFQLLTSLIPEKRSYVHEDLASFTKYTYLLRAFTFYNAEEKTSSSCRVSVTTYDSPRPDFLYIRYVTVNDNGDVDLSVFTDTAAAARQYHILRGVTDGGTVEEIALIDAGPDPYLEFTDMTAEVNSTSYYYHVNVIDSCGIETSLANVSRTILLQVSAGTNQVNTLTWNAYEEWQGSVAGYDIYRKVGEQGMFTLLDHVDAGTLSYQDDVSSLSGQNSIVYYRIEAKEGDGNDFGFRESSWSNIAAAAQQPRIYMPNAFAPRGMNNILRPVTVFVQGDNYLFSVYNRWGQLIFQTKNPTEGWDGTYQGSYVPMDVYVYQIRYRGAEKDIYEARGSVAVIF